MLTRLYCIIAVVFLSVFFVCTGSWAMDFSVFSNQELFHLQGAASNASAEEQEAYQREWQSRLQSMSEEEKKKYAEPATSTRGRIPVVIQGQGYESGPGTVIYGGMPPDRGSKKSGGK